MRRKQETVVGRRELTEGQAKLAIADVDLPRRRLFFPSPSRDFSRVSPWLEGKFSQVEVWWRRGRNEIKDRRQARWAAAQTNTDDSSSLLLSLPLPSSLPSFEQHLSLPPP